MKWLLAWLRGDDMVDRWRRFDHEVWLDGFQRAVDALRSWSETVEDENGRDTLENAARMLEEVKRATAARMAQKPSESVRRTISSGPPPQTPS